MSRSASSLSLNDSRDIEEKIKCLERELCQEGQAANLIRSNDIKEPTITVETHTVQRIKGSDWLKEITDNDGDQTMNNQTTMNESMFNNTTSNLFLNEADIKRKRVKYVKYVYP